MTFIDLFSGIGGFRLGMEMAGHECKGHCEIDKFADKSYRAMHDVKEDEWYASDIKSVDPRSIPKVDCWCFGFPCQDISVAGKQTGFAGKRSSLFFSVTNLIRNFESEEDKPSFLFIENVKNFFSVNGGYDFLSALCELDEIGYDAEWRLINSKNFGVPQNRERVFIIGHLRGRSTREVFPISGSNGQTIKRIQGDVSGKGYASEQDRIYMTDGITACLPAARTESKVNILVNKPQQIIPGQQGNRVYDPAGISVTIQSQSGGLGPNTGLYLIGKDGKQKNKDYASCLTGGGHSGGNHSDMDLLVQAVLTPKRNDYGKEIRKEYEKGTVNEKIGNMRDLSPREDGISNTLTSVQKDNLLICVAMRGRNPDNPTSRKAGLPTEQRLEPNLNGTTNCLTSVQKDNLIAKTIRRGGGGSSCGSKQNWDSYEIEGRIRRLTPRECFRLQGFPDEYFDRAASVNSDSQLYKQAGNSVTVNVIYEIAKRLRFL